MRTPTNEEIQNATTIYWNCYQYAVNEAQTRGLSPTPEQIQGGTGSVFIAVTRDQYQPKKSYSGGGSSGGGNFQSPTGEHGYCKDCKAPLARNPKTGKIFCSAKCWLKNDPQPPQGNPDQAYPTQPPRPDQQ